jgi:hypothetical protein
MFLVKLTRNRGRGSMWVCPLDAVQVVIICLKLMTLKPKSSRLVGNIFCWCVWGKARDYCRDRLSRIWGEGKIVEIIFLQVGFHWLNSPLFLVMIWVLSFEVVF